MLVSSTLVWLGKSKSPCSDRTFLQQIEVFSHGLLVYIIHPHISSGIIFTQPEIGLPFHESSEPSIWYILSSGCFSRATASARPLIWDQLCGLLRIAGADLDNGLPFCLPWLGRLRTSDIAALEYKIFKMIIISTHFKLFYKDKPFGKMEHRGQKIPLLGVWDDKVSEYVFHHLLFVYSSADDWYVRCHNWFWQ